MDLTRQTQASKLRMEHHLRLSQHLMALILQCSLMRHLIEVVVMQGFL